jgi:hypothetical protein
VFPKREPVKFKKESPALPSSTFLNCLARCRCLVREGGGARLSCGRCPFTYAGPPKPPWAWCDCPPHMRLLQYQVARDLFLAASPGSNAWHMLAPAPLCRRPSSLSSAVRLQGPFLGPRLVAFPSRLAGLCGAGASGEMLCGTCFCDVPWDAATAMDCGHAFCNDCWRCVFVDLAAVWNALPKG